MINQKIDKITAPRFSTRDITLVGTFTALMAVFTQIVIPMVPVPFSMGIFAALLTATVLPTRLAVTTQAVYLLLGAVGAPVFAQFQGGFQRVIGPTGGYLIGYVLMALTMGKLLSLRKSWSYGGTVAVSICGIAVCYLCGTLWLAASAGIGIKAALMAGVVPFAAPDVVKALLSSLVGPRLRKLMVASK